MRVAVSISDKTVKVARLSGNRPILVNVSLPEKVIQDGLVVDEAQFKQVLLKLSHDLNLPKHEVVLGVSEKHIFSKKITITDGDIDFEQKVKEELASNLPSDASETYTDWQILEKAQNQETIYLVSASAELLDSYLALFEQCKITVVGIEPLSFAITRHIPKFVVKPPQKPQAKQPAPSQQAQGKEEPKSTLVVLLEGTEAVLTIINEREHIELTSVLPSASLSHIDELISEISEMKTFYERKGQNAPVGRVCITGEGSSDDVKNQLTAQLALPVEMLRIPHASIALQNALSFFPVYALLSLPLQYPKDHTYINLLPEELLFSQERLRQRGFYTHILAWAALAFGILSLLYTAIFSYLYIDMTTTNNEIAKKTEAIQSGNTLETRQQIARLNKEITLAKKFQDSQKVPYDVLSFLAEKTPAGVTITRYTVDVSANSVLLSGESLERDRLLAFKDILETEGKYKNVKIPLTSLEKKGASIFSLSFELNSK